MSTAESLEKILERHYTIPQIAARLGRTEDFVRKLFEDEPGILKHGDEHRRGKRRYVTIMVPESVLVRKIRGMQR
jgi:predicted transcriptional regulator